MSDLIAHFFCRRERLQFICNHFGEEFVQRHADGRGLLGDVLTLPFSLDHFLQAADLAFNPCEPRRQLPLGFWISDSEFFAHLAWLRPDLPIDLTAALALCRGGKT